MSISSSHGISIVLSLSTCNWLYIANLTCTFFLALWFQYEGDDEDVDVEKVDAEMVDLDINSEVEIEQI